MRIIFSLENEMAELCHPLLTNTEPKFFCSIKIGWATFYTTGEYQNEEHSK